MLARLFLLLTTATVALAAPLELPLYPDQPTSEPADVHYRGSADKTNRSLRGDFSPAITILSPTTAAATRPAPSSRPAIVICPGGGYSSLAIDDEGFNVAQKLADNGVIGVVLRYRLPKGPPVGDALPVPIQDVQRAIRLVRANALEWGVDPKRVGVMGFSAGGHVAASALTKFDAGDLQKSDAAERQSSKPDFGVLVYPVISMRDGLAHGGSRKSLLGPSPSPEAIEKWSADQHLSLQTPQLFVVHAADDKVVKIENSEALVAAAGRAGVPCKFIRLDTGGHGFGLGRPWFDDCVKWMRDNKFLQQ